MENHSKITIIIFLCFVSQCLRSQIDVVAADFRIENVAFETSRKIILEQFGKPINEIQPRYECGFLSENLNCDNENVEINSLQYLNFAFTGGKIFVLESVNVSNNINIFYKALNISKITSKEFEDLFLVKIEHDEAMVRLRHRDDAYIFYFENNVLNRIEYWSPC